jgi:chromosome segregation ATPase
MTKDQQFQKELLEKVKPGVKASILKLKKSKSADDIITPVSNIPLKKSNSQLEIPVTQQPSPQEQITNLKDQVKFHAQTATNYLSSLQTSQAKVSELEKRLKTHPPNSLLQDQLKEKQKEVESLRAKLDDSNQQLTETTEQLDNSLFARHKSLQD